MLIRINGARSGIKEYLEDGQKKDRFFTRDELDNRVILDGNLAVTDLVINSIKSKKDRYFHITLAFKEDFIEPDILEKINQEFKDYFLHSYTADEINYYAEAHLPKIKSYFSAKDNTLIERKPHIHIVIPRTNLFNGNSFNPSIKHITKYVDAFQEYINARYGLESPKDNLRTTLDSKNNMISRYKGDLFNNQGKGQKIIILNLITEHNPTSFNQLKTLLQKNGYIVKVRNKEDALLCYLNVRLPHEAKGINLKESVFRDMFLKLPLEEKLTKITQQSANEKMPANYLQASPPKPISRTHKKIIQEWKTTKALEHRFLNRNSSNKQYQIYQKLSDEEKLAYLHKKQAAYYTKYNKFLEGIYNDNKPTNDDIINVSRSNDTVINNLNKSLERIGNIKVSNDGGYILRESLVKISQERYRAHLSNNTPDEQHSAKDSVVTELLHQDQEKTKQQLFKNYLHELNTNLHADILLALVKKIYGINPDIYQISKNNSGYDRIKCGNRNLAVVDFCTKELNLSFKEAVQLLDTAYNMQNHLQKANVLESTDDIYLKDKYQQWFKQYKATRAEKLKECSNKAKVTREAIMFHFKNKIKLVRENRKIHYLKKAQHVNILKADQIIELKALTEAKLQEQKLIRDTFNLEMHSAYRAFLTEQANLGDTIALKELRRLRAKLDKENNNNKQQQNSFKCVDYYSEFRLNITYEIDNSGNICYKLDNKTIIKDTGRKIEVIHDTADNVKLTLELALAKFGKNIELSGTAEFRRKVVDLAIKEKRNINFLDDFSKQYHHSCLAQQTKTQLKTTKHSNNYNKINANDNIDTSR